ncbi:GerAB/ArcD/ProY family transporter [Scatolibacter rhodanostii]|uniref:GerAB/ArcD/ProY family transporter n=1 Tax=Scatolibacter rhodanostii TaxID=2014781 RepID=UPI000C0784CA|nr:endospore germination permease [Scatolibacter rhodanostii]
MKLERDSISPNQFMFSIICFMHAIVLRSGFIISITRQDSWIMSITGFIFSLLPLGVYVALMKNYPNKNLIEINQAVFGKIVGNLISLFYLFFFLSLAALNTHDLGHFVLSYMLPETPVAIIVLFFLGACFYSLKKGVKNIMHLSTLIAFVTLIAMIINSVLIAKDTHFEFIFPLLQLEPEKYVQGTVSIGAVVMGEVLVFTMLTPMLKNGKKVGKSLFFGMLISTFSSVVVMIRNILTLGPLVTVVTLPTFESIRNVSLADIFTRLESIYAILLVILFVVRVSILIYVSVLAMTQIFSKESPIVPELAYENSPREKKKHQNQPPFLLLTTALTFFYSLIVFESPIENSHWGATVAPFFSLTFELLLPAITLVAAIFRKIVSKKKEVNA